MSICFRGENGKDRGRIEKEYIEEERKEKIDAYYYFHSS